MNRAASRPVRRGDKGMTGDIGDTGFLFVTINAFLRHISPLKHPQHPPKSPSLLVLHIQPGGGTNFQEGALVSQALLAVMFLSALFTFSFRRTAGASG